jgi:hypothetical protein
MVPNFWDAAREFGNKAARRRGGAAVIAFALLLGCTASPSASDGGDPKPGVFYAPQGIAASERYVLVANSGFHFEQGKPAYDPGFVTLIDRRSRRVVSRVPTSALDPQRIAVRGDRAYVVSSGRVGIDEVGLAVPLTDGAFDILDLGTSTPPSAPLASITLGRSPDDRRIGGYAGLVLSPDGKVAFVGSGTRGDVFKVDLEHLRLARGPERPIAIFPTPAGENGLTVPVTMGDGVAVLDFNTDELCVSRDLEGDLTARSCSSAGVHDDLLEGPIDAAITESGDLLVLMSVANALYRVDPRKIPFSVDRTFATTGLANNRVVVHQGYAYVLNSLSNNLQRIHLGTRQSDLPFAVLPVKSNPYDMVVTEEPEGDVAWVTLYQSHQVALVHLGTGALLGLLPGDGGSLDGGVPDAVRCPDAGLPLAGIGNVVRLAVGEGGGAGQDRLPGIIQGGPSGSGAGSGSTEDVLSLGSGGEIVVDFGDYDMVDGPGPDFIVFENPFLLAPYTPFAEPAVVGLGVTSADEKSFVDFPCDLSLTEPDVANQRWPFPGCAGVKPVLARRVCTAPIDPTATGGDAFDLADLGLKRARYLRLRDAGLSTMGSGGTRGFDLDAVVLIHYEKR